MKEFAVISPWSNAEVSPSEWTPIDSAPKEFAEFARQCFGVFFTKGEFASMVLPVEQINESIQCVIGNENTEDDKFTKELRYLINKHSKENNSDTPDFILAKYLKKSLDLFDEIIFLREDWYGRAKTMVNDQPEPISTPKRS
jgi:hypothetical protein